MGALNGKQLQGIPGGRIAVCVAWSVFFTAASMGVTASTARAHDGRDQVTHRRGVVLAAGGRSLRVVGANDAVRRYRLASRAPAGLGLGSRVRFVVRSGRVSEIRPLSRASRIRFYGRVVKLSAQAGVLRLADGRTFRFHQAGGAIRSRDRAHKRALSSGRTVLTTLSLSAHDGVSVSLSPVAPTVAADSSTELAGTVTSIDETGFSIQDLDGDQRQFVAADPVLLTPGFGRCAVVVISYHRQGGSLVADQAEVLAKGGGYCADSQDDQEAIGPISAMDSDAGTLTLTIANQPVTFGVNRDWLPALQVGERVKVLYFVADGGSFQADSVEPVSP